MRLMHISSCNHRSYTWPMDLRIDFFCFMCVIPLKDTVIFIYKHPNNTSIQEVDTTLEHENQKKYCNYFANILSCPKLIPLYLQVLEYLVINVRIVSPQEKEFHRKFSKWLRGMVLSNLNTLPAINYSIEKTTKKELLSTYQCCFCTNKRFDYDLKDYLKFELTTFLLSLLR